jgi:uncharacterized protein (DUF305 family)
MRAPSTLRQAGRGLAVVALLATTGCTGGAATDPTPAATATSPTAAASPTASPTAPDAGRLPEGANAADVLFVQMMIPHHEQALEMVALAPTRFEDEQMITLVEQIRDAQGPEIDLMRTWLEDRNLPEMTDHTGHAMPGMVSDADMARLAAASGTGFDTLFLRAMIAHHEGAVAMAEEVLADGEARELQLLAREIIRAQQREIATMQAMLSG